MILLEISVVLLAVITLFQKNQRYLEAELVNKQLTQKTLYLSFGYRVGLIILFCWFVTYTPCGDRQTFYLTWLISSLLMSAFHFQYFMLYWKTEIDEEE